MKKIFHFDVPREPYQCDAAVVSCFDHRFALSLAKFLKHAGIANPDMIIVAGGAKHLVSPEREGDREFLLQQVHASIRLHRTQRVILTVHSDCGAYGGLSKFDGNLEAEARHHEQELRLAAACVRKTAPNIDLEAYFIGFDGISKIENL